MAENQTQDGVIDKIALDLANTIRCSNVAQFIIAILSFIGSCTMTVGFVWSFSNFELSNKITAVGAGFTLLCGLIRFAINLKQHYAEDKAIRNTLSCLESMRTNVDSAVFEKLQLVVSAMCLKTENPLLTTLCSCVRVREVCEEYCPSSECCSMSESNKCRKCTPKCCQLLDSAAATIIPGGVLLSSIKDFQKAAISIIEPSKANSRLVSWHTFTPFRKATEIFEGVLSGIGVIFSFCSGIKYGYYVCKAWKEQEKRSTSVVARKIEEIAKITKCRLCTSGRRCEQHGERGTQDVDPSLISVDIVSPTSPQVPPSDPDERDDQV